MIGKLRDNPLINEIRAAIPAALQPALRDFVFKMASLASTGRPGIFGTVAIETTTKCNRACSYCPVSNIMKHKERGIENIKPELFSTIIDQLSGLGFSGKLALQGYGEPLLDPLLKSRIAEARKKLPTAYITINSNGDYLRKENLEELIKAGLSHVYVTNHSKREYPHKYIQEILEDTDLNKYLSYYHQLKQLQNRGGSIDISEYESQGRVANANMSSKCRASANTLNISSKGEVIVCDNDYDKEDIFGMVSQKQTIEEIWFDEKFREVRNNIRKRIFDCGACQKCNIGGDQLQITSEGK